MVTMLLTDQFVHVYLDQFRSHPQTLSPFRADLSVQLFFQKGIFTWYWLHNATDLLPGRPTLFQGVFQLPLLCTPLRSKTLSYIKHISNCLLWTVQFLRPLEFLNAAQLIDSLQLKLQLIYCPDWQPLVPLAPSTLALFLMHGGFPPASITQSGLATGESVHGEPKSKARESMYTNSISTCSCLDLGTDQVHLGAVHCPEWHQWPENNLSSAAEDQSNVPKKEKIKKKCKEP